MSDQPCPSDEAFSPSGLQRVDEVCDSFEDAWKAGQRPQIEDYLNDVPQTERSLLLRELLVVELQYRCKNGETLAVKDYLGRFPEHADLIQAVFADQIAHTIERIRFVRA